MFRRRRLKAGLLWLIATALLTMVASPVEARPQAGGINPVQLVHDARSQIGVTVRYDPEYTTIPYPNGDVAQSKGACTDVVTRAMRQLCARRMRT